MPDGDTLLGFLGISILLTLAPGPDNLMVLAHSLAHGRKAGLGIALGCALGCVSHVLWATLGVSATLAASPKAFVALKIAGALYLAWLGIGALRRDRPTTPPRSATTRPRPWHRDLMRGFIANAINPKVALFFLAFMPQFVAAEAGHTSLQMAILGAVFMAQTIVIFGAIALAAGGVGRQLRRRPGLGVWLDRLAGVVFIALAIKLVASPGTR